MSDSLTDLYGPLRTTMDFLEARYGQPNELVGVSTGFSELDALLFGLQRSNLIILAARPGMGKTSLALSIARHVAGSADKPVLMFSMEMGSVELTKRLLAIEARVDAKKLWTGDLSQGDWDKINHAVGRLAETRLFVDDNARCTVVEMRAKARRLRARYGDLGLVVVDYVQLMTGSLGARPENRQAEVAEISRGLKLLARELDCPVLALSQLNRQVEYRQDKRPALADLRESGNLEQDADVVCFIYREELYERTPENEGLAEISVAKHRNGPTGTVALTFVSRRAEFNDGNPVFEGT